MHLASSRTQRHCTIMAKAAAEKNGRAFAALRGRRTSGSSSSSSSSRPSQSSSPSSSSSPHPKKKKKKTKTNTKTNTKTALRTGANMYKTGCEKLLAPYSPCRRLRCCFFERHLLGSGASAVRVNERPRRALLVAYVFRSLSVAQVEVEKVKVDRRDAARERKALVVVKDERQPRRRQPPERQRRHLFHLVIGDVALESCKKVRRRRCQQKCKQVRRGILMNSACSPRPTHVVVLTLPTPTCARLLCVQVRIEGGGERERELRGSHDIRETRDPALLRRLWNETIYSGAGQVR